MADIMEAKTLSSLRNGGSGENANPALRHPATPNRKMQPLSGDGAGIQTSLKEENLTVISGPTSEVPIRRRINY